MTICKLCLLDKELKRSHIIPEFMYADIYDKDPKRFYEIKIEDNELKSRIEQKGKREFLLCEDCETKLSVYEKIADENLYGKNQNGKAILVNQSMTNEGRVFFYEFENFDYKPTKLFLDSLLWRLIVSETIHTPEYEDKIKEQLRASIFNEEPLEPDEFPCIIQSIMTAPGKVLEGFILSPVEKSSEKMRMLCILIDGLEYNYYIDRHIPDGKSIPYLQKSGELTIIGRLIYDIPDLMEIVKQRMDHLEERLKTRNINKH